jgi:transcriptional regulator with XRE-family HTH domain
MARRNEPQLGLGAAIRSFRTEVELSQETLGLQAEIHPTWISHIESGRINPTWGSVRRIAASLGVSLPELAALAEEFERKNG